MKLYELANPSDAYTYKAPNIVVAGVCASLLSHGFSAVPITDESEPRPPILFGWGEWYKENGIDNAWLNANKLVIADCFDSFLIGDASKRKDVEEMLAMLPDDKKQQWRDERQDRNRSSMNTIGESAYSYAKYFRERETV